MSRATPERYGGWALVTGASSGLGTCFAESLARRGFSLALTARRADRLHELAGRLAAEHGVATHVVPLDLAAPGAPAALVEAVGEREIGVLVNNAGFGFSGGFWSGDPERDGRMIALNCAAPVALTHAYLPAMRARARGAVVFVASTAGFQPTPWFAVYGATKSFDLALGEALWHELRGSGVDAISFCPGETRTEFAENAHMGRQSGGMEPGPIVEACLERLGRGPSYVPGALNRLAAFLHRVFPRSFVTNATGKVLARELLRSTPEELRQSS